MTLAMIGLVFAGSGCATPGPNHVYILSPDQPDTIRNNATSGIETSDVPSYLESEDVLLGLAYDSYTDHLFLRLAPGNAFRVVDRPDRSIKREFTAPEITTNGGGDLTIRSRDRHLFLSHPTQPALIEITLYGKFIRTITLAQFSGPPTGVAYDQKRDLFYILRGGDLTHIVTYDLMADDSKAPRLIAMPSSQPSPTIPMPVSFTPNSAKAATSAYSISKATFCAPSKSSPQKTPLILTSAPAPSCAFSKLCSNSLRLFSIPKSEI